VPHPFRRARVLDAIGQARGDPERCSITALLDGPNFVFHAPIDFIVAYAVQKYDLIHVKYLS
jgi:hypothetical protein